MKSADTDALRPVPRVPHSNVFRPYQRLTPSKEKSQPLASGQKAVSFEKCSSDGYARRSELLTGSRAWSRTMPEKALSPHERSAQRSGRGSLDKSPVNPSPGNRRTCNCKRSNCLKLYCDCFASGEYCSNCNCNCCYNNKDREAFRKEAVRIILDRNPGAFRPKIATSQPLSPSFEVHQGKHCKVPDLHAIYRDVPANVLDV